MDVKLLAVSVHFGFGLISCPALFPDYHYLNLSLTWADAQRYCRMTYTDLATLESADDMQRLNRPAEDASLAWIGLSDDPKGWRGVMGGDPNSWRWTATGKGSVTGYQNFAAGQPNNSNGKQTCVAMSSGAWNDLACDAAVAFVCYTETNSSPVTYKVFTSTKSFAGALAYCRTFHTDLVMIESAAQNSAVASLTSSLTVWIGLYRSAWKWSDSSSGSFRNWQSGRPSNVGGSDFCAAENSTHLWLDSNCGTKRFFWCYKAPSVKTFIVRMRIQADALSDPAVDALMLQQLGTVLQSAAQSDAQITWIIPPRKQDGGQRLSDDGCL